MSDHGKIVISNDNTPFERISASYYDSKIALSEKDEELKKRWEAAFSSLLSFYSTEQTAKKQVQLFNISLATAYRDVVNALSLFGDIHKSRKEGWRHIIAEYNTTLFQMATKEKDMDIMGKCLDRMIKLRELDKEDSLFNPEKLAAMSIEIKVSSGTDRALRQMIKKGVVNLNDFEVEDISYEDVEDEEGS